MASLKSLLPAGKTATEDLAQRDKFFMILTLAAISPDLAPVQELLLLCLLLMMCLLVYFMFPLLAF